MKVDEPPGVDAVELVVDEAFDIPFQPLGLPALLLLYLGLYRSHLSFGILDFLLTQKHWHTPRHPALLFC